MVIFKESVLCWCVKPGLFVASMQPCVACGRLWMNCVETYLYCSAAGGKICVVVVVVVVVAVVVVVVVDDDDDDDDDDDVLLMLCVLLTLLLCFIVDVSYFAISIVLNCVGSAFC